MIEVGPIAGDENIASIARINLKKCERLALHMWSYIMNCDNHIKEENERELEDIRCEAAELGLNLWK